MSVLPRAGIADLAAHIHAAGARTLGEYFSRLDPHQARVRNRWTARSMYEKEFDLIWETQKTHHPAIMNDVAKAAIHDAIFHQRPLKSSAKLVGFCDLERRCRRAPMGCLIYQRYRIVQMVNDLTWRDENGALCGPLSVDDPRRLRLIDCLDACAELSLTDAKKLLGLGRKARLMIENGPAKKLVGNKTVAVLAPALGDHWARWTHAQREAFVNELLSGLQQEAWRRRLIDFWRLPADLAHDIADLALQAGYAALSRRAMRRLLLKMEAGVPLATARKELYGDAARDRAPVDLLPGVLMPEVRRHLGKINNPAVIRALTELRKVVNELIRAHGKPLRIRVELARDLRNTREKRAAITRNIQERTDIGRGYSRQMQECLPGVFGGREPRRAEIEKWALAVECNWICPYTGMPITPQALFGPHAQFDIEHIIPRGRRPDDSFINKTLCHSDANRMKGSKTPFEAFHGTDRWEEMLARVARFQGSAARAKMRLFTLDKIDDDFVQRDLNDTRYASRLAKDYLGLLYGGADGVDAAGNRCVQVCCGGITAIIRNELGLNRLLSDDREKNREDHRHHAVDALVIALAGPRMVQELSVAAERAATVGRRRYDRLAERWPNFWNNVREVIDEVVVSHRVNHTLSGPLHEQTNYSAPKIMVDPKTAKPTEVRHVRKKLVDITPSQVENIVDPKVKKIVLDFLDSRDPKKVFKVSADFPTLPNRRNPDRPIPIRKVRIREVCNAVTVGAGGAARHVVPGENNHLEVVASHDKNGQEQWDVSHVVSRLEANERLRHGQPVVRRDWGETRRLVMALRRGDYLELEIAGRRQLMRVVSIGRNDIQTRPPNFAAATMEKDDRKAWRFQSGASLRAANPRKVSVSPAGRIRPCNE